MRTGVQFRGQVPAGQTRRWFTHSWPENWHVTWYMVPTSPKRGAPQLEWDIEVERASSDKMTYWINVKNLSGNPVDFEARYAILN